VQGDDLIGISATFSKQDKKFSGMPGFLFPVSVRVALFKFFPFSRLFFKPSARALTQAKGSDK
jgi:hypothetical protein